MDYEVQAELLYHAQSPCDVLLQIDVAVGDGQRVRDVAFRMSPEVDTRSVAGEDGIGVRRWFTAEGDFRCTYSARVQVHRADTDLRHASQVALRDIPDDVTKYLMPSRYCFPEDFFDVTGTTFGDLSGGALVMAMSDWITSTFTYDITASQSATTATQSFQARAGVCRDFAHVLIAMARAVGIPARIVSAYAPRVTPQDFHALAEVYLDGTWHMVDPTGMSRASDTVCIGVGRDAADVSFMTSYGPVVLIKQTVAVVAVAEGR